VTFFLTAQVTVRHFLVDMTTLQNLTAGQLRKAISIKERIEDLEAELASIGGGSPALPVSVKGRRVYKRSKEARMAMAAAQKRRWAKLGTKEAKPKKRRKMSAAGRAKIAAAAKARWAKVRAAGKKRL
jgi:hypothetical protein